MGYTPTSAADNDLEMSEGQPIMLETPLALGGSNGASAAPYIAPEVVDTYDAATCDREIHSLITLSEMPQAFKACAHDIFSALPQSAESAVFLLHPGNAGYANQGQQSVRSTGTFFEPANDVAVGVFNQLRDAGFDAQTGIRNLFRIAVAEAILGCPAQTGAKVEYLGQLPYKQDTPMGNAKGQLSQPYPRAPGAHYKVFELAPRP
jgi:hypothetical protein